MLYNLLIELIWKKNKKDFLKVSLK